MGVQVKFLSDLTQTSVELTADKMQNLLTKQEPKGAYDTDLLDLQKKLSLKLP